MPAVFSAHCRGNSRSTISSGTGRDLLTVDSRRSYRPDQSVTSGSFPPGCPDRFRSSEVVHPRGSRRGSQVDCDPGLASCPALAPPADVWLSSHLAGCAAGRRCWLLAGESCCTSVLYGAPVQPEPKVFGRSALDGTARRRTATQTLAAQTRAWPDHLITGGTAPGRVPRLARSGRPAVQQAADGGLRLTYPAHSPMVSRTRRIPIPICRFAGFLGGCGDRVGSRCASR